MKNKILFLVFTYCFFTLSTLANSYPEGLVVHPTENIMVVGHESGSLIIIEKTTFKHVKTIKVLAELEKLCFSKDGNHLWVYGENEEEDDVLIQLNTATWEKTHELECDKVAFSSAGNKVAYVKDYFATDMKILDLTSTETVGGLKMAFSKENVKVDYFEFSTDGTKLLMAQYAFGEDPCEILIFPSEGFVSTPLTTIMSPSKITTGFATGLSSAGEEYVLIGWSETVKIANSNVEVIDRGYNYCFSFCASPDGKYFFIGNSRGHAIRFELATMKKTELDIEEMKGVKGDIVGISTVDGKTYYFLTDEYIVGTINADGFVLKQNFISMNVNVILDSYDSDEHKEIVEACKANGCNVEIPKEYDEENPTIIASDISVSAAYSLIEKLDEADVSCEVAIME